MMEKIESLWKVGIRFNEIQFIGIAPRLGGIFASATEQALLTKAVDYIVQAQKFAECMILIRKYCPKYTPKSNVRIYTIRNIV